MEQIADAGAPFPDVDRAIAAGHAYARRIGASITGIVAEPQPGGYFCRLAYSMMLGRGGRAGRNSRHNHTVEIGKIGDASFPALNETWLSGRPYYCALCGLGFGEFIACEEGDRALESAEAAQARLIKAHREGKGMPTP
jgi:hypothetical protein